MATDLTLAPQAYTLCFRDLLLQRAEQEDGKVHL
jgi:hypothetical protein